MNELSDSDDEIDGNKDVKQCSEYDVLYKALMVGESGVGKTAFVRRYMNPDEGLPMNLLPTLGIDYVKIDKVIDGVRVRTLLWDTVGQERFRTITKNYFRGAKGILLLYDVTERSSFNMINHWVKSLRMFDLEYAEIYLVGNKIDLSPRQVDYEEGKQLAYSNGMKYVETSAKTCENIKETMEILISNMKDANHAELKGPLPAMQSEERVDVINLKDGEDKPTKKSKCCHVF